MSRHPGAKLRFVSSSDGGALMQCGRGGVLVRGRARQMARGDADGVGGWTQPHSPLSLAMVGVMDPPSLT
eukprot:5144685-Alexandrium_andersonii.AAC.1